MENEEIRTRRFEIENSKVEVKAEKNFELYLKQRGIRI